MKNRYVDGWDLHQADNQV
jgi:hypothetical protein